MDIIDMRTWIFNKTALFFMLLPFSLTASAESEDLLNRIEEIEELTQDIEEKVGSRAIIHAFDGESLDIGGFIHSAYTMIDARDESASSFDRQNFELLASAEISNRWTAFFAGGFLRESDDPLSSTTGGTRFSPKFNSRNKNPHIIGWTNYQLNDKFQIRMGRIITPHGVINIEHFPATLLDPEQPQFLRPFSGNTLFPNFSTGIMGHGKFFIGNSANNINYAVYLSNFTAEPEKHVSGARIAFDVGQVFSVGTNYSHGNRTSAERNYALRGLDCKFDYNEFLIKTEYYKTTEDEGDRKGYYFQPAFRLTDKWIAFYRYDFLDTGTTSSAGTKENVVGLNFMPSNNIRLRAIYKRTKFDESRDKTLDSASVNTFQFSGTFSF